MWAEFGALAAVPMMVIRGENSDLLSADTLAAMAMAHDGLEAITVTGEGHAPVLRHGQLLGRISAFITAVEGAEPVSNQRARDPAAER